MATQRAPCYSYEEMGLRRVLGKMSQPVEFLFIATGPPFCGREWLVAYFNNVLPIDDKKC